VVILERVCEDERAFNGSDKVERGSVIRESLAHLERQALTDDSPDDEAELVAAAQRDRTAFAPLYDRYARPIYRYCYRRLGSHEAAEDATSQTFVKALAAIGRYCEGSFRAWLFTIADRVVTDLYRRRKPQVGLESAFEVESLDPGPEELFISVEASLSVQAMIARLTPEQQRIVALRLSGLTGPEIAAIVGRETQAVKSMQFRAYARLRRWLGDEGTRLP
jgi:RNA polymerase sigma factor (sigma-70 family)